MLKTIHKTEFRKILSILEDYYEHLKEHPNSLQTRYYGLHKIRYQNKDLFLLVMNNMFGHFNVDYRYDLKGSKLGRRTVFKDGKKDLKIAIKDLDFVDNKEIVEIYDEEERNDLLNALKADSVFLAQHSILDYSTLVGIIDVEKRMEQVIRSQSDPMEDPVCRLIKTQNYHPD